MAFELLPWKMRRIFLGGQKTFEVSHRSQLRTAINYDKNNNFES